MTSHVTDLIYGTEVTVFWSVKISYKKGLLSRE